VIDILKRSAASPKVAIGIAGYHYQQITDDSGSGDRLGAFEGRTTGLGRL
jgi:hypothetical protein